MKVCCPKCGGGLVIESIGQYGVIRKVGLTGTIHKTEVKVLYGIDGANEDMVYCRSCGWNADGHFISDGGTITPNWEERA